MATTSTPIPAGFYDDLPVAAPSPPSGVPAGFYDDLPAHPSASQNYSAISKQFETNTPTAPTQPIPPGLQSDQSQMQQVRLNPRTGLPMHDLPPGQGTPLTWALDTPITGGRKVIHAVQQMAEPAQALMTDVGRNQSVPVAGEAPGPALTPELSRQGAEGLHQAISGAFEAATPLMAAGAVAAPLATAATLATGMAAQTGVSAGLKVIGLDPEYADVVGDLAGLVAAAALNHLAPPAVAQLKSTLMHRMADKVASEPTAAPTAEQPEVSRETPHPRVVLQKLMEDGHSIDHLNHTIATVPGLGKAIESGDLATAKKLLTPARTQTVTQATPNPPTASLPTAPESPETIAIQTQQLLAGTRRVVMFPAGQGQPVDAPGAAGLIKIAHGEVPGMNGAPKNTYWYRSDLIYPSEIHKAEKANTLPDILGPYTMEQQGTGAPDKSQLPANAPVATARAPNGTEVQATATTPEALPQTVAAAQPLGRVSVETPGQVVGQRGQQPVAELPQASTNKTEKGTSGELFRGGWDVPLNETGRQQVASVAQRTAGQFSRIVGGTLGRHAETMGAISEANPQAAPPEIDEEFNPMNMGALEGQPVNSQTIKALNEHVTNHFEEPLPGVGKYSGLPGTTPAAWVSRLISGFEREMAAWKPGQKTLIVTSGRDIQAFRAWAAANYKGIDLDVLTAKWKTEPGELLYVDPRTGELSDVKDAKRDGIYIVRHGTTDANAGGTAAQEPHEFSSTQVNLPSNLHQAFNRAISQIPEEDLNPEEGKSYGGESSDLGRETEAHITVKYGLHAGEPSGTAQILAGERPITATIGKLSIFKGEKADVVKLDIDSPDLQRLNKAIAKLPHTDTHPVYHPHMTLAYVKPGEGQKYVGLSVPGLTGEKVMFDAVEFSAKDRTKTSIPLQPPSPEELLFTPGGAEQLGLSPGAAARQAAQFIRKVDRQHGTATPTEEIVNRVVQAGTPEPAPGVERVPSAGRTGPAQGTATHSPAAKANVRSAGGPESGRLGPGSTGSSDTSADRTVGHFLQEETGTAVPGAIGEAVSQFASEDVAPKVRSFAENTKALANAMVNFFVPRRGVRTRDLDEIYKLRGGREAVEVLLSGRLDKWSQRVDQMTIPEMTEFIDRQKRGQPQPDPELQGLSDFLRKTDDDLWAEIAKYKPTFAYLENHYRVLWKVIPAKPLPQGVAGPAGGGGAGFKGPSRKSLEGSKGFLKQHKLEDMSEGIARGGVPYSYNPIHMFEASYADAMKFITAQRIWEVFGKTGTRKFVKFGAREKPEGFVPLNDRIAKIYFPVKEGMVNVGEWYVEENAARALNNMLGRDYLREVYPDALFSQITGRLGKTMLAIKNATTAIELGLSPFHAVFEGNEAIGSMIGIGLREIVNLGIRGGDIRQVAKGIKDIVTAPKAAVTMAIHGAKAKAAFRNLEEFEKDPDNKKWLAENPDVREGVMAYFDGGGKFNMPNDYRVQAEDSFQQYWKSANAANKGHYLSAAARAIPHFNELLLKPLFEKYIPDLKIGFFLREYALAKEEYADRLSSGEMSLGQLKRMVVDSVDNRFGEMNFDNLFWDRTMKTAAQIVLRSVTWKLGNIRANFGALAGLREIARGIREGKAPLLDPSTAWLLGMSIWTAILGGTIHRLATGSLPHELKDFVYPVIDKVSGMRVSIPTYWRDIVHFMHSPGGYVKSSLSGEIGRIADILEDKDFYNVEVFHKDDPVLSQAWDIAKHMIPMPFSVSSYQQAKAQGGTGLSKAAGFAGFTKAPKYIDQTKAEELAFEYYLKHRPVGARTTREAERTKRLAAIRTMLRRGEDTAEQFQEMRDLGLLRPKDELTVRNQARQPELQHSITNHDFTLNEVMNIYEAATPEEKEQVKRALEHRLRLARNKPDLWDDKTVRLAQKYFGIESWGIRPPPPIQ